MKKMVALLVVLVIMMSISISASATTFTKTVDCKEQTKSYTQSATSETKSNDDFRIYVQYNAQGCSNSYTNHFRAFATYDGREKASKWVKPVNKYYLENGSAIDVGYQYYMKMRGNTNYEAYEGLSSIVLSGYFTVN